MVLRIVDNKDFFFFCLFQTAQVFVPIYPPPTSLSDFSTVVMKHVENFYKQLNGINIDDNHSLLLANITMHFATTPALPILKILLCIKD